MLDSKLNVTDSELIIPRSNRLYEHETLSNRENRTPSSPGISTQAIERSSFRAWIAPAGI